MRVSIFVSHCLPHIGGQETMVDGLAHGLAQRHDVTVVSTDWQGFTGRAEENGIVIYRLPSLHFAENHGIPYPLPTGSGIREAIRLACDADVIHVHGSLYATSILAARLSKRIGKPLVLTEHVGFVDYRNPLLNGIQRAAWVTIGDRIVRRSSALTTVGGRVRRWLQSRFPDRHVSLIRNGIDVNRFRPAQLGDRERLRASFGLPLEELLVLFVGRNSEKKNFDVALTLLRTGFRLIVCGARREVPSDVIDLGMVAAERMPELFQSVDVLVNPSKGEGFPLVIQEAAASGVSVVVLWDSGYSEVVDRDVLVSCDRPEEIGPALESLLANSARRREVAERARAWAVANWGVDAMVSSYEATYLQELERVGRPAS